MQTSTENTSTTLSKSTVDAKIMADLAVLKEKMKLAEEMLRPPDGAPQPSLKDNKTMLNVVGFLEACAPRMVELVEVGTQGDAFGEEVLMECLQVNDALQTMLSDIDTLAETETTASTTAASAPQPSIEEQLDDLLLENPEAETPTVSGGNTKTGEDDPFGNDVLAPAEEDSKQAAVNTKPAAAAADPFGNDLLAPTPTAPAPAGAPPAPPADTDPFANETLTPAAVAPAPSTTIETAADDFDSFLAERSTK
jgi:hypothetical protein